MSETQNYHFDFCPACSASGKVWIRSDHGLGAGGTAPNYVERDCGVCQGSGLMRLPNGWHIVPDAVGRIVTAAGTNADKATARLIGYTAADGRGGEDKG